MNLQKVSNVTTYTQKNKSSIYTIATTEEIKFYQIPAFSNTTSFLSSELSHLTSWLGLRTTADLNRVNQTMDNGGLLNTSLGDLPESFNNGLTFFSIPTDNYRVYIDGSRIEFKVPLNGTSGLTATTLYSSYFYTPEILDKKIDDLCSGTNADKLEQEYLKKATSDVGIGYQYIEGTNPDKFDEQYPYFKSGVVYLYSDDIKYNFTGATGSSLSWSYNYNTDNPYVNGKRMAKFSAIDTNPFWTGPGYDRSCGVLFLNSGTGFLWGTVGNTIDWATINGDPTSSTGASFTTSGVTYMNATDVDLTENLRVKIIMEPNQWVSSPQSSYVGLNQDCGIAATTITLHDNLGRCLAVGKVPEPIIKDKDDYVVLDVDIALAGQLTTQDKTKIY